ALMPSMCGNVLRYPKVAPDAVSITLLRPGVMELTKANKASGSNRFKVMGRFTMTHPSSASPWTPLRCSGVSLADPLSEHFSQRIRNHGLRAGMRLPSVRAMAKEAGLSRFTVVQAYDRLVAQGLIQSRRGAGFYVCPPSSVAALPAVTSTLARGAAFDTAFLLRSMFRDGTPQDMPGGA